jgi:RHS repeat-associated protein
MQFGYNNVNELVGIAPGGNARFQGNTNKAAASASLATNVVSITSKSANATTYSQSTSGGATETITLGTNLAGNITATIGGSPTTGDTLTITTTNSSLSGGQESVTYTVLSTDNLVTIAAGLTSAINADAHLQAIFVSASSSSAAALSWAQSFSSNTPLTKGNDTAIVSAIDGGSNTKSNNYQFLVSGGSSSTLTYDANGNLTNDGTNSYAWDAENRLIQITYPGTGNYSTLSYDALGRCAKIQEYTSNTLTSSKQFVWCMSQRCESRDGSGTIISQYFCYGQVTSGTTYFYTMDHLGGIREVTNSSGSVQAQYGYDPYGQITLLRGTNFVDFQYAGYYFHARSGLNLTMCRSYSAILGRWLNRDPLGESASLNLYSYVNANPIRWTDPFGLEVRVYASPAFGSNDMIHVFVFSTEANAGAGRGGSFGSDSGRQGLPENFNPMNPPYSSWPYNVVSPNEDGTYGGRSEQEFIDFVGSSDSGLNGGPFIPGLNDCHNGLKRAFDRAGVHYPGDPLGRFGQMPSYSPIPFAPGSFIVGPND